MDPLKRFQVKFTDLTGIDIGVVTAEITVSAFTPGEAEMYALGFARGGHSANFDMETRELLSV